eukprot:3398703-Ditylum_brightwellii.AAC.1
MEQHDRESVEAGLPSVDRSTDAGEAFGVLLVEQLHVAHKLVDHRLVPSRKEKLLSCIIDALTLHQSLGQESDPNTRLADTMASVLVESLDRPLTLTPKIPGITSPTKNALSKVKLQEALSELNNNLIAMEGDVLTGVQHCMAAIYHSLGASLEN